MRRIMKKVTVAILLFTFVLSSIISQSIKGNWRSSSYSVDISGSKIIFENRENRIVGKYDYYLLNNGNSIKLSSTMSDSRPFSDGVYSVVIEDTYLSIGGYSFSREKASSGKSELSTGAKVGIGVAVLGAITGGIALKEHHDNKVEADLLENMNGNWKFAHPETGFVYEAKIQNKILSVIDYYGYENSFDMKINERDCELVERNVYTDFTAIKAGKYKISISEEKNILTIQNKNIVYKLERTK